MRASSDSARFLDHPLFFVIEKQDPSGAGLFIRPGAYWYFHIAAAGALCIWPLIAHAFLTVDGVARTVGIVLGVGHSLVVCVFALYATVSRVNSLSDPRANKDAPFGPGRRGSLDSWIPALLVCLATSVFSAIRLVSLQVLPPQGHSGIISQAPIGSGYFGGLLLANVAAVLVIAALLGTFSLPFLTESMQRLPEKIRDLAWQGVGRSSEPSELWRYLDDIPQVVRRLALHELIFRKSIATNLLAATLMLLVWRMAAIFFPLLSIFMLPFVLEARDAWTPDLKLPLALCVSNWAAFSLSYYVYTGKKDLTIERLRLKRFRHITLFRAIGLQPEREIIAHIYPYYDSNGVKTAAFLFTVVVPLYLGLIDLFP